MLGNIIRVIVSVERRGEDKNRSKRSHRKIVPWAGTLCGNLNWDT